MIIYVPACFITQPMCERFYTKDMYEYASVKFPSTYVIEEPSTTKLFRIAIRHNRFMKKGFLNILFKQFVPDCHKTLEMCKKAVSKDPLR